MRKAFFAFYKKNSIFFYESVCNNRIICVNYSNQKTTGCRAPHTGIRKDME